MKQIAQLGNKEELILFSLVSIYQTTIILTGGQMDDTT